MNRKLEVIDGPAAGTSVMLADGQALKIGRGQASDVRLDDPRISRLHCTVEVSPQGVILADAGSTGGTFFGGGRIAKHRLTNGDEFQIGDSRIRFHCSDPVPSKPLSNRPAAPRLSAKALNDLAGQKLDHFKLERIIHTGCASVLFLANDEQHSRPAVVKVMLPSVMSDDEQKTRFVRAVHTMINVKHDNLVQVYGAGKQGPFCWCAMEYVDGISVLEMIELIGVNGRLDWREAYRVAVHIGRALECADKHKVIHRNVAPENLLQRKNDQVVKLCDLMLAKALEGTQAKQITVPGQIVGNLGYMAPERLIDTSKLDWRSDQYGLGATLFALLTGHPPFQAPSLPELIKAIRSEKPQFPAEVIAETNNLFLKLVLKMLGKTPDDRFAFPDELLRRLAEIGKQSNVDADLPFNF